MLRPKVSFVCKVRFYSGGKKSRTGANGEPPGTVTSMSLFWGSVITLPLGMISWGLTEPFMI
jgi:hypothetical protein